MRLPQLDKKSWILLAAFAGLNALGGLRLDTPLAAWLAPVFGIRFMRTQENARRGFWMLALAAAIGGLLGSYGVNLFYPVLAGIHVVAGFVGELLFTAIASILLALIYAIDRWVLRRWFEYPGRPVFAATLIFPVTVTALDFGGGGPLGTFGATAYSNFGWLPVMQFAAVAGLWGIAFLMAWFASTANYVWESGFNWREAAPGVAVYGTVLLLVLGFGVARLATSADVESDVRVVGLTSSLELPGVNDATYEAEIAALHSDYLVRTEEVAERGAEIVVWPETGAMGPQGMVDALLADARALAGEHGIYLVVTTAPTGEGAERATELHIIDPNGGIALRHTKYGGTDLAAMFGQEPVSRELRAIDTPHGRLSGIVCWDADFPETVRQIGTLDVDLLLIPANDWYELGDLHAQMAVFRSVENGVSIFRQASNGVSLTTDAYGRVLTYLDSFDGALEQDVRVPINSTTTIYPGFGDVVGQVALAGLAVMLVGTWLKARRAKKARQGVRTMAPGDVFTPSGNQGL